MTRAGSYTAPPMFRQQAEWLTERCARVVPVPKSRGTSSRMNLTLGTRPFFVVPAKAGTQGQLTPCRRPWPPLSRA